MDTARTIPARPARFARVNWPLFLGALLVIFVFWAAVNGPSLAPKDPLERTGPLRVDGEYLRLPYPPGTPGFPLGTDNDGRDLLSRILWGIRPTLSMVLIVAAVRLVLGTVIGLAAGWSDRWPGRLSSSLIRAALAIPVVMVALGGIAAVGVELGIWAFVFGLSLTGWVEAARMVRERTAAIRTQVYVEAATSLGAGDLQILFRHVLRQVLSMLAMLFAFEISSTLMLTAALGFLGYYIGGDVWVQVTDAVAEATASIPELGQMLATTDTIVTRPWPLLTIGGVVFTIVLGFNLLGEGLRRQASLTAPKRRNAVTEAVQKSGLWFEDRVLWPFSRFVRSRMFKALAVIGALALLTWAGWNYFQTRAAPPPEVSARDPESPRWAGSFGDPAGSRLLPAVGPTEGKIAWSFEDPAGFSGGPVVAKDGLVIAAGLSGTLYGLNPDGSLRWQTRMETTPAGTPALDSAGRIYLADAEGGLSAYSPVGIFQWRINADSGQQLTASPVAAPDGMIYFVTGSLLQAVRADGSVAWQSNLRTFEVAPLQIVGSLGLYSASVIDLEDGRRLDWLPQEQVSQYFSGPDGSLYFIEDNTIYPFTRTGDSIEVQPGIEWDHERFTTGAPKAAGALPGGRFWLFYSGFARGFGFGEDTRVVWLNAEGDVLGNIHYGTRNSAPIGLDQNGTLFSCGNLERGYGPMDCQAFGIGEDAPRWTLPVDGYEMAGAALVSGRLYVTTSDGHLHAIGAAEISAPPAPTGNPTAPAKQPTEEAAIEAPPPYTTTVSLLLSDSTGFPGSPALAPDGSIFILSRGGTLYRLRTTGEVLWQQSLPENGAGAALVDGDSVLALDRAGLNVFTLDGDLLWRFEHAEGTAIDGPVLGPDGAIYYTLQTRSNGAIQAVGPDGSERWITYVQTFSYFRPPQVSPNGQLILFDNEVFDARDGAAVDLQLDFEPDDFVIGEDRQLYLKLESTFVRWSLSDGRAVLAEERVISPHELGTPILAGTFEDGTVWFLYRAAFGWFTPDGIPIHTVQLEDGFFSHLIGFGADGVSIACGRNVGDFRRNAVSACTGFSPEYDLPLWSTTVGEDLVDFTGGVIVPGGAVVALENGELYLIQSTPANSEEGD